MVKENNNKVTWIIAIVILVIVLMIFVPNLIKNKKELENLEHEGELIEEGKVISDSEVINEILNILKERNENRLNQYITTDFEYWKNRKTTNNKFILDRLTISYER